MSNKADFAFIANNDKNIQSMLDILNIKSLNDLFIDIPSNLLLNKRPNSMPKSHTELETLQHLSRISKKNLSSDEADVFLGSGFYDHFIPASVNEIMSRAEFRTSYTPYAPELSQGLLTTLYEYQSMICELTGHDIANTSMYDWSTALAEAALMCVRISRKKNGVYLIPDVIHKDRYHTLLTYAKPIGLKIEKVQMNAQSGSLDLENLQQKLTKDVIGVYIENPNFFGLIQQNIVQIANIVHQNNSLLVVGVDLVTLGILESPGEQGADICIGEGQHLGTAPSYGGPSLGIFTTKNTKDMIRNMPGRIIGYTRTKDDARDAYIMTLQTREQHIRRERATSNICTNQSLVSVAAAAYLSLLGPQGLISLGQECIGRIQYLIQQINLAEIPIKCPFDGPFFKEALLTMPSGTYPKLQKFLLSKNIIIGPNIGLQYPNLNSDAFITSVTEKHQKSSLDHLLQNLIVFFEEVN